MSFIDYISLLSMVIALVAVVLGVAAGSMFCMNKAVDQSDQS
jgi:hypothetical protein